MVSDWEWIASKTAALRAAGGEMPTLDALVEEAEMQNPSMSLMLARCVLGNVVHNFDRIELMTPPPVLPARTPLSEQELLTLMSQPDWTTPGQSLLPKLIAAVVRGDPPKTVPYRPDSEAQEFWKGCMETQEPQVTTCHDCRTIYETGTECEPCRLDAQAAPGQPIPKELEPEEPPTDPE
jgi:hypothetical protein